MSNNQGEQVSLSVQEVKVGKWKEDKFRKRWTREESIIRQALLMPEVVNQLFSLLENKLNKKDPNLFTDHKYLINIGCADIESVFGTFGIGN